MQIQHSLVSRLSSRTPSDPKLWELGPGSQILHVNPRCVQCHGASLTPQSSLLSLFFIASKVHISNASWGCGKVCLRESASKSLPPKSASFPGSRTPSLRTDIPQVIWESGSLVDWERGHYYPIFSHIVPYVFRYYVSLIWIHTQTDNPELRCLFYAIY